MVLSRFGKYDAQAKPRRRSAENFSEMSDVHAINIDKNCVYSYHYINTGFG